MHVGYEMIDTRLIGYNHLISNKREWKLLFYLKNQEILLDLDDFIFQEGPEDDLMTAISLEWYDC